MRLFIILLSIIIYFSNNGYSQKKSWEKREPISEKSIGYCDSLLHNSQTFIKYLQKFKIVTYNFFDATDFQNKSIETLLDTLAKRYDELSFMVEVDEDRMIRGIWVDYFYDGKYRLQVAMCLHTPVLSCCGLGGELTADNTLDVVARKKNYDIIKSLTDFTVFQFKSPYPESYWHKEENQKLKELLKEYKKNQKKKRKN